MLINCAECGSSLSDSAAACPKCGHPLQQKSSSDIKKRNTNSAGWISLISVVFANLTPAILAPIFVLSGIIFASKELNDGEKKFGVFALCLSLLQGWFVLDHFNNVSGALGIVNAKDIDSEVAHKYASASLDIPNNWNEIVQEKCSAEWPSDFRMRKFCIDKQNEAARKLSEGAPQQIDVKYFRVIRGKCAGDWPRDFKMRVFCEQKQYESLRALNETPTGDRRRNSCAQQWPEDYSMRRYCETKQ